MFEAVKKLFKEEPVAPRSAVPAKTMPPPTAKNKAWVVLKDGRVGYIDHYKINGLFGVRPVVFESGLYYANPSEHWSEDQKLEVPEEIALSVSEIRAAEIHEIPTMWRK